MSFRTFNGKSVWCAEHVPWVDGDAKSFRLGTLGVLKSDLSAVASRGQATAIAQLYGLVLPGLRLTEHVFRGLARPLFTDGSPNGDAGKLVYSRVPAFDCLWNGGKFDGRLENVPPPTGAVFAVFVSPNVRHQDEFPAIDGWINHWAWIDEDKGLRGAPVGWVDRFDKRIWTRGATNE